MVDAEIDAKQKLIEIAKKSGISYAGADRNNPALFTHPRDQVLDDIQKKIPHNLKKYFVVEEMDSPRGMIYGIKISYQNLKNDFENLKKDLETLQMDSWKRLDVGDLSFIPSHKNMGMEREQQDSERAFSSYDMAIEHLKSIGGNADNIGIDYDNEKEYTIITRNEKIFEKTNFVKKTVFQIGQRI